MNAAWVQRYELKSVLSGHRGCVNTIHWSSHGEVLVSGSDDMTLKLWRLCGGPGVDLKPVASLATAHRHNIFDAHLLETQIVSCGADGYVCLTSLDGRQERLFQSDISQALAFKIDFPSGRNSKVFLVTFGDGYIRHFDLRERQHHLVVNTQDVGLAGLATNPDGHSLAVGGNDPFLRIYDIRTLSFQDESSYVNMPLSPVTSLHSTLPMVRKQKKAMSFSRFFSGQSEVSISGVSWDATGRLLLANYRGGDIELFDFQGSVDEGPEVRLSDSHLDVSDSSLPTGRVQLNSIRSYTGRINKQTCAKEVRFLCQGSAVGSGGDCGHFYIWSTTSSELLRKMPADRCVVNCIAPHPELPLVATSGIDAEIKAWDVDRTVEHFQKQDETPDLQGAQELQEEGLLLIRQGAWVEAIDLFEQARNLLKGRDSLSAGQAGEAEQTEQGCLLNCAFCHLNLEEYDAVIECCTAALDQGPSVVGHLYRARAAVALRRPEAAQEDLEALEALDPENPERFGTKCSGHKADPMGAVTAFRSCEAGGAPAAAYRQGIHLMRPLGEARPRSGGFGSWTKPAEWRSVQISGTCIEQAQFLTQAFPWHWSAGYGDLQEKP
ncbi:unnamed protein product [Durusdinium trenchii]|uniref:Uncharacterized protein n=1 Tax=Durusdinium trenchii TaxID=1381693 RepID=A0ABP0MS93_9DINO